MVQVLPAHFNDSQTYLFTTWTVCIFVYFDKVSRKNALYHHPNIMVIFLLSFKKCNVNLAILENY
jgi:hypothetical protein